MYQALYRKWRPKTFSDVVGQAHITQTLQKQVSEGRTSHAYLFTGTRGTGKTTCAKILAKAVNCEHPENGNPCCRCPSCIGIENGTFLDVLELDAASNNGVDQVRALRDEAIYSPAHVKKRVYIIDEVHMLSLSAFNALLKILEEPPEHLMFILATTELHKVPATILSRCQRFSFKRIQPEDIAQRLQYVAGQESIDLTPDGAELLSRLADGALRDALSLLDQCAASGGTVSSAAILDILGLAGSLQTAQLLECIVLRDANGALVKLSQLYEAGKDVGAVLGELSVLVRDLLVRKTAPEGGNALLSGSFDAASLERLGAGLSASRLLFLSSTLQQATANLYLSSNRRIDAELCVLRLCDESLCGDFNALNARIQRLEERIDVLPAAVQAARQPDFQASPPKKAPKMRTAEPPPESRPDDPPPWEDPAPPASGSVPDGSSPFAAVTPSDAAPDPAKEILPEPAPTQPSPSESPAPAIPRPNIPADAAAVPSAEAPGLWHELAEASKGQLPAMYRVFLDKCRGHLENGIVTVYVPDEMTKGRLNNDRVFHALEETAEKLTGAPVQVRLLVGVDPQASPEDKRKNLIEFGSQFDSVQIK